MKKILIINGPNLNFLGIREPEIYGNMTYEKLCSNIYEKYRDSDLNIKIKQSNYEGEIIGFIQKAYYDKVEYIIINPGAYTHYSYAIMDAINSVSIPTIEVHLTDISKREDFRKISVIKDSCIKQIQGFGTEGYIMALEYIKKLGGI